MQELNVKKEKKNNNSKIDFELLSKSIKSSVYLDNWFEKAIIEKITFNDIKGSFKYIEGDSGFLSASSDDFTFNATMFFESHLFNIQMDEYINKNKDISISGNLILNNTQTLELISSLNVNINNDAKFKLYAVSDIKRLTYKIESLQDIGDSRYIVDMLNMNSSSKYWVYDAIDMSSLSINSAYGFLEYKKIDEAYLNLHVKAVANNLKYKYDKKLQSVNTLHTDLEFKNGVLYIKPKNAYTYGFFLDKSWLKIDFSKKEEILTLHLLFDAKINKELLSLLNRYKIKLPFIQTQGNVNTNLKLLINLRTADVTANGDFYAKQAQIDYLGLDLGIYNAHVVLNNSDIKVKNMFAKYKNISSSHVDLDFNARESKGVLDFRVDSLNFNEIDLKLKNNDKPLHVKYTISPGKDNITINESNWILSNKLLNISSMSIPFDMKKLTARVPITSVKMPKIASSFISGDISFKPIKAKLNIDLLNLNYKNIKLNQPIAYFDFIYNSRAVLSSKSSVLFNINDIDYTLNDTTIAFNADKIMVKNLELEINDKLKSKISAMYDLKEANGLVDIHNIEIKDTKFGEIFKHDKITRLQLKKDDNEIKLNSNEYDIECLIDSDKWKLNFNSINKISKDSKILKEYSLTNGNFTIYKKSDDKNIKFSLNSEYKYKVIVKDNTPIKNYTIKGEIESQNNSLKLNVNDYIDVNINNKIEIEAKEVGINVNEILNFISDRNSTEKSENNLNIALNAKDSYLHFSKNRNAVSDNIELQYYKNKLDIYLAHKKGRAELKFNDDKFNLYGKNFGDEFMNNLFALSKFKKGILDFAVNGSPDEHNGVVYIRDTTILDYKLLNNVLAFVNTIPSLVTFSLPGYNKNGLKVNSAYMDFKYKDEIYKMNNIFLKSKEIDILGKGESSIKNNTIDIDLNLKTDLGSAVSKIPLVGYILLGKNSVSTSLKVRGKLDDPEVKTQVVKDILIAPINIIKRTLMLPFEIFKSEDEN